MSEATLLSKLATLPADMQAEVADFVDFLLQKTNNNNISLGVSTSTPEILNSSEQQVSSAKAVNQALPDVSRLQLKFGAGKEVITYIADDFDALLDDFKEYM